jgi:hypothetical protein
MRLTDIFTGAFELISDLAEMNTLEPEAKFTELVDDVARIGEGLDDLVEVLPGGYGIIAKNIVDNPTADNAQRLFLWTPIAQALFEIWKWKQSFTQANPEHNPDQVLAGQ